MRDEEIEDPVMCGRITLTVEPDEIARWLHVDPGMIFEPRYNIAPTQWVPVVRTPAATRRREIVPLRWGFVPPWATELAIGNKLINARAETVFEKNSFRTAIRRKRCIVPASGFYEWKRAGKVRQPFYFRRKDARPLALAGLWEYNGAVPEGPVETFTILTTAANALLQPLHDRMPVILPEAAIERWLDSEGEEVADLLTAYPAAEMELQAVSSYVNDPSHEGPGCLAPPEAEVKPVAESGTAAPVPKRRKAKDAPGQGMLFE